MRSLLLISCSAALAFAQAPAAAPKPAAPPHYKTLKYPALNQVKVPEPVRFELANGMVVFLVEDDELPMISVEANLRGGSRWEPAEKAGVAAITGTVMRTGGTKTRNGDLLDEELDRLGAAVETSVGRDMGRAMVSVLKEDADKGIEILADLLQNPAFPQDKIDLAKIEQRDAISRRNDDPGDIANREFARTVYGKDSPYARIPEYETIDSITRDDLVAFHEQFFQPENAILGVWGDFDAAAMRTKIEKAFGAWKKGGKPKPQVPVVTVSKTAGVYFIPKDDVNQSTVVMGYLGGRRNDPDYAALSVMNSILGSGFGSRLLGNIRTKEGLSYYAYSAWAAGWDYTGHFKASGATKSETTVRMIESFKRELRNMSAADVTDDELARAKDSILKGAAFDFDSTGKIVRRMMTYEYYGYPKDYLQQYQAAVRKVTKADVLRVAKQYVDPGKLAIVVLGNQKEFGTPLAKLGEVTSIDISIPQPKQAELGAATPESAGKGKALLAAARTALGGDALAAVKDYTTAADATFETPQGAVALKLETTMNLSGRMVQKVATPMGDMTTGYDGQVAWMRMGENTQELPGSQRSELEGSFFRDTFHLMQNLDRYSVQALGEDSVAVTDSARNLQMKLYFDPKTNLPSKKVYTASLMGPPAELEETYSDYREVGGMKVPFKYAIARAGKKVAEVTVSDVKINPGVAEGAYKKPDK